MTNGTVCLSFDFDAISLWLARGMTTAGPVSRGEFAAVAVPRVLELLKRHGITSTWFIPGHTIETYRTACGAVVAAGHEVGLHGYAHELRTLDPDEERSVFERSFELVGKLTGRQPLGYRAPGGQFGAGTVRLMVELGMTYDSSLMANDVTPYWARYEDVIADDGPARFGAVSPIAELPISWSLDDWAHFEYAREGNSQGLRQAGNVFANWLDDVRYMVRDFEDGVLTIVLHPEVIGRGHRLLGFERFVEDVAAMDVEYAPLCDVAAAFANGRSYGRWAPDRRQDDQGR